MDWFGKLKQILPANNNVDLPNASEAELEDLLPDLPLIDMYPLRVYRATVYNNFFANVLHSVRKAHTKLKIDLPYTCCAGALAIIEAGQSLVMQLALHNPAAGELLKRHIKEKIAKW